METLDLLNAGQPVAAVDRAIEEIRSEENIVRQVEVVKQVHLIFQNFSREYPTTAIPTEEVLLNHFLVLEFFALLDFEIEGDRLVNRDTIRSRILGGIAPRTDVPTIADIEHADAAVQSLEILEAISGKADPILVAGRHLPRQMPPPEERLRLKVGDSFDLWYPTSLPKGLNRFTPIVLHNQLSSCCRNSRSGRCWMPRRCSPAMGSMLITYLG